MLTVFLPNYVGAWVYAAILPEYQIVRMYAGFCKYLKFVQDNKMSGIIEIILMHTQNIMLATMCCLDRASVSTLPTMQWTHGSVPMVPAMQDR